MRQSKINKFLSRLLAVILFGFLCFGLVLLLVLLHYYDKSYKDTVVDDYNSIIDGIQNAKEYNIELNNSDYMYKICSKISSQVAILDDNGYLIFVSNDSQCISTEKMSKEILSTINENTMYVESDLDGFFSEDRLIVYSKNSIDNKFYYVLVSSYCTETTTFFKDISIVYIACMLFAVVLTAYVYLQIRINIIEPVNKLDACSQNIVNGKQTETIEIDTNNELNSIAKSLNEMNIVLSNNEKLRKDFIANVSHELRTPMTTINGFVEGILDGTIPKEKEKQYLIIVHDEVKRLSNIVNSMLNMSRIEEGQTSIKLEDCNIINLVVKSLCAIEKQINDKNIEIDIDDSQTYIVKADIDLIHQVVYNLIENAIKFVNKGGYIRFTQYVKYGYYHFAIRNSGEGVKKDELPLLFDRFYKTDSSRGKDKFGAGLGLYISSKIIRLHNGDFTVSSVENEYTEFVFTLPYDNNKE